MRRLVAALLVALSLVAAACGDDDETASSGAGGEVTAVAAVFPLAWMAEQVAPDADVTLLNAGGVEAHDLELTPSQRGDVETAAVVLFVGDIDYQPQVEQAVGSAQGEVISLVEIAGPDRLLEAGEDDHADEEGDGHADEEGRDEGAEAADPSEEGDDHPGGAGAVDAHIWFDTEVMAAVAIETGEAFAAADPDNEDTYRENAEAVRDELAGLGDELKGLLGGECTHDEAIVSHEAYGYLLAPFGHAQHGVTGINPEAGASSAELGELVEEIEEEGFEYVLTEPVEGREGAETVAREAGVELLEVSPLDAVGDELAVEGFPALLREQAEQFATALACT